MFAQKLAVDCRRNDDALENLAEQFGTADVRSAVSGEVSLTMITAYVRRSFSMVMRSWANSSTP